MTKKRKKPLPKLILGLVTSLLLLFFIWIMDTILLPPQHPQEGGQVQLYANQTRDDLRGVFLSGINEAQRSILLIIYGFTDQRLLGALKQKSEEGIAITVICDPNASPSLARKLGSNITVFKRFGSGLMHQKILVVDDEKVWIGSANFTGDSLKMHGNLVNAIHSPQLAKVIKAKASCMMSRETASPILHQDFASEDQKYEIWFLPDDKRAVNRILSLIRTAEKTIRVAMFTWTREDFAKAIIEAQLRGVHAEVAIDRSSSQGASSKIALLLQKGKIPVFFNRGQGLLHHKFLYIDGKTLVNGSANWTKAAFTKNDDCFMILHDLTEPQRALMDKLWEVIKTESVSDKDVE